MIISFKYFLEFYWKKTLFKIECHFPQNDILRG